MSSITDILDSNYKKLFRQIQGITGRKPIISLSSSSEEFDPVNNTYGITPPSKFDLEYIKEKVMTRNTLIFFLIFFILTVFFTYSQPGFLTYQVDDYEYKIHYSKLFGTSIVLSSILFGIYYWQYGYRF